MIARLACVALALAACGKKRESSPAPASALRDDAGTRGDASMVGELAIPDAQKPEVVPVDVNALPAWPLAAAPGRREPTEVYAADGPGQRLLVLLATDNFIARATDRRITGRVEASSKQAAFLTVAAQLGVRPERVTATGKGVNVDLQLAAVPAGDVLRLLAEVGRINVVAPGALPRVTVAVKRMPWDAVIAQLAAVSGRTIVREGNVWYLMPPTTRMPVRPDLPHTDRITLTVNDGTISQAIAALQQLADVPVGACTSGRFSLRLKNVSVAEAVRALALASNATLTAGTTCAAEQDPTATATPDYKVSATVNDKHVVAIERRGATILLRPAQPPPEPSIEPLPVPGQTDDRDLAVLRRVSALLRVNDEWSAFVETRDGQTILVSSKLPYGIGGPALAAVPRFSRDGIRVDVGPAPLHIPFAREPATN